MHRLGRWRWALPLALAIVFAYPAYLLARSIGVGALISAPNRARVPSEAGPPAGASAHHVDVDGARLAVWRLHAEHETDATILVLHGVRDRREVMLGTAGALAGAGYDVLLVDLRGHGGSTGDFLTYGARDGADLVRVIDALAPDAQIGVYGPSYGGAAALQLAARDPRVRAVMTVSTFSSLRAVVPDHLEHYAGPIARLIPDAFFDAVYAEAEEQASFRIDDADTTRSAGRIRARVLLLHGDADTHIRVEQAYALHRAIPASELVVRPGYDHVTIMNAPETRDAMLSFFASALPSR